VRSLLLVAWAAALVACGDSGDRADRLPPPPGGRRSEVVVGSATPKAEPKPSASAAKRPRAMCKDPPAAAGRKIPDGELVRVEEGASLPEAIATGGGVWTWVNLWAGWCGPCKEEMPMLVAWEKRLREAGSPIRLAFVSIDDDERQARRFLSSQPAVRASYRLAEGEGRSKWLGALGVPESPELPVHLLFDGQGALRCTVTGAISEADFGRVREIVSAGR
jgi:thiol-disulfide isomerase/thioredoxin